VTLADFGVDPDEPQIEETRYECEARAGQWMLVEPTLDESVTPAKTRCPSCGNRVGAIEPVLLHYGREDGLLLACRLCQDCRNIIPVHTASNPDELESIGLSYPYRSLRLYDSARVRDSDYPNWDYYSLSLDGTIPTDSGGDRQR